jgi:hypothetical protein
MIAGHVGGVPLEERIASFGLESRRAYDYQRIC